MITRVCKISSRSLFQFLQIRLMRSVVEMIFPVKMRVEPENSLDLLVCFRTFGVAFDQFDDICQSRMLIRIAQRKEPILGTRSWSLTVYERI